MNADPLEDVAAHIADHGIAARPLRAVVVALTESPHTLDALITRTALPRRQVEDLLETLGTDLERTPRGMLIRTDRIGVYRERFAASRWSEAGLPDPLAALLQESPRLLDELRQLLASAPNPQRSLDHVTATPETAARRALWMDAQFDLAGARLLCVGDHDLTSLAMCAVNSGVSVTVVDVDERILEFVDHQAQARGWQVRCLYGDLRYGLPNPARAWADLVFTDPPYTPAGVRLFLRRGLEGMRARDHGRLLLAYGFGGSHPGLGVKVQREIQRLHLAFEAILPDFHRYQGAQAIGSASDMYVCRPTARAWRVVDRTDRVDRAARAPTTGADDLPDAPDATAGGLYTRGPRAVESQPVDLDPAVSAGVIGSVTASGPVSLLVGEGWARETAPQLSLSRLFNEGIPPSRPNPSDPLVVGANLTREPAAAVLRLLLAINAERVAAVVPNAHPDVADEAGQGALAGLLRHQYALRFLRSTPTDDHAIVIASRQPPSPARQAPAARLTNHVLARSHGKVANTWREGLVRLSRNHDADARGDGGDAGGDAGAVSASPVTPLSKNVARELVMRHTRRPELLDARLLDLPRHQLGELLGDIANSAANVAERG